MTEKGAIISSFKTISLFRIDLIIFENEESLHAQDTQIGGHGVRRSPCLSPLPAVKKESCLPFHKIEKLGEVAQVCGQLKVLLIAAGI